MEAGGKVAAEANGQSGPHGHGHGGSCTSRHGIGPVSSIGDITNGSNVHTENSGLIRRHGEIEGGNDDMRSENARLAKRLGPLRKELRQQMGLAAPIVLLNVLEYMFPVVSLMFVGHLSQLDFAGASVATSMAYSLGYIVLVGMAVGMETLCGQAYGAQKYEMLGTFLQQGFIVSLIACVPLSVIFVNMERILRGFRQDPEICKRAGRYAMGLVPSLFGTAILQPLGRFLQMQSVVWPEVFSSGVAVVIHVFICWLLTQRMGLGIVGAALSTGLSYWLNVGILVAYVKLSGVCKETWKGFSKKCIHGIKQYLTISLSSLFMIGLDYWCYSILIMFSGWLPNPQLELSALNICLNTTSLYYMVPLGIAIAASLRISNELGAGRPEAAKFSMYVAIGISLVQGILVAIIIYSIRNVLGRAFNNDKDVIHYVSRLGPILSLTALLDSLQAVLLGVAAGCGWQKLGACVSLVAFYSAGVPLAIVMGFVLHMRGKGIWIGLTIGLAVQTIASLLITIFISWDKQSAAAKARLETIQKPTAEPSQAIQETPMEIATL